jgi:hypothetical protein
LKLKDRLIIINPILITATPTPKEMLATRTSRNGNEGGAKNYNTHAMQVLYF